MILHIALTIISALLTFNLIKRPSITPTRASTLVSLTLILVLAIMNQVYSFNLHTFSSIVFGGSFIGMCSHKKFNDLHIIFSSLVFIIVFNFITPHFIHLGGALGFSAFISICTSYALFKYSPFALVKKKSA